MNIFALVSISSDHLRYLCNCTLGSDTGNAAGAPVNANTGYSDGGNLVEKQNITQV